MGQDEAVRLAEDFAAAEKQAYHEHGGKGNQGRARAQQEGKEVLGERLPLLNNSRGTCFRCGHVGHLA